MKKNILLIIPIFLFLLANIYYSQKISPTFFELMNDDRKNTIIFLKDIKGLPEYNQILAANTDIFDQSLKNEINYVEIKRKKTINELEALLQKNPQSRDILYGLYLLYKEEGNNNLASEYLNKALKIDPSLNNFK